MNRMTRLCALMLIVLGCTLPWRPAIAQRAVPTPGPMLHFTGQVLTIDGSADNPRGFVLQTRNRAIEMKVAPSATFSARSAEADVEGFAVGDYANITARREDKQWVAYRVVYDILPIAPAPDVAMTGVIARPSLDGVHYLLRADSGLTRWFIVFDHTRYRVNGQTVPVPPPLNKGVAVVVTMRHVKRDWVAIDINIRTSPFSMTRAN